MSTVEGAPRIAFSNRTNITSISSPNLPDDHVLKRRVPEEQPISKKRARTDKTTAQKDEKPTFLQDTPVHGDITTSRTRNRTTFNTLRSAQRGNRRVSQPASQLSTRSILSSFVSSNKSDVYQLHSRDDPVTAGLPFACAFTNAAKHNGTPIMAVATQDGTVVLLNVTKRKDWDAEPQRTTIQVHEDAILDLKWSLDDEYLATSSGDSTTRITSVVSQRPVAVLAHHTSSVKAIDWDPEHADLLSTASRDGSICVWDIRTASQSKTSGAASTLAPVAVIPYAHCDGPSRGKTTKSRTSSKSVTSILYLPHRPQQLLSSGSFNGVLKQWDLRYPGPCRTKKSIVVSESHTDPTLSSGSRGRGISSLALGKNHTLGNIWGMAADSCIHTYTLPLSVPSSAVHPPNKLAHPNLFVNSFYVKLAVSPCGSWLASGSSGGGVYLWDVASRTASPRMAVELKASGKEIDAIDWTGNSLAACCDDGTVRIWRPDFEVMKKCKADPAEQRWDWTWVTEDL